MNHTLLKARVAVKNACEDASKPMEKKTDLVRMNIYESQGFTRQPG
jgi:hypothetical protein